MADTTCDGKRPRQHHRRTGSSAPNLLGKFNDKTALEVDRTGNPCDGNVYFAYSRFTGNGGVGIYFSRSTDHGATFTHPMKQRPRIHDVQFPDISVTGNGHVYITFRQFAARGPTRSYHREVYQLRPHLLTADTDHQVHPFRCTVESEPEPMPKPRFAGPETTRASADEAGHSPARVLLVTSATSSDACISGYTFFRRDTQVRSTADQRDVRLSASTWSTMRLSRDTGHRPGTTDGSIESGTGGQAATFFLR